MKIKTLEYAGFHSAIHAMRNPMDSWKLSDTITGHIGKCDRDLSMRLANAGEEHAKHLRMVMVWADITAPRYWWTEFDTYRVGVEKVSCSTMHTLMKRKLTRDDFEKDCIPYCGLDNILDYINAEIDLYNSDENPEVRAVTMRGAVQLLPQSFLQTRTVMMSYAALRNMYRQRENHKLKEWHQFREWIEDLPESWMITDIEPTFGEDNDGNDEDE